MLRDLSSTPRRRELVLLTGALSTCNITSPFFWFCCLFWDLSMLMKKILKVAADITAKSTRALPHEFCLSQVFTAVSGAGNGSGLLLILTELTGLYAISTILLIRKQLPLKYRWTSLLAKHCAMYTACCACAICSVLHKVCMGNKGCHHIGLILVQGNHYRCYGRRAGV